MQYQEKSAKQVFGKGGLNLKLLKNKTTGDIVFDIVNYAFLTVIGLISLYPLIFILSASVSDPIKIWNGEVWLLPKGVSLEGYMRILKDSDLWRGYSNSLGYTVLGTSISLILTILAAYPMSRKDFKAKNILMAVYTFTMFFNGGLIPTYLLVRNIHMLDTIWAVILPTAVSTTNIIISRTFFQSNIPDALYEAAEIDGCSDFRFFISMVLPLSGAIIAVMALFDGVKHWNAYFNALIYLTDRNKFPLQLYLREILIESQAVDDTNFGFQQEATEHLQFAEMIKYGLIVVSSVPMLIIYPFVQKYFIKGVMIGSVKG